MNLLDMEVWRHLGRHCPNSELEDSGDTYLMLEIRLLEEGVSGIFGAAVAVGASFCNLTLTPRCREPRQGY